ncbi:MAG: FRG domain-containing protein, partial [Elusimicrobiota bacterium]|nr:FRG domain-containing protein [Elusimicrobiota bacterium]
MDDKTIENWAHFIEIADHLDIGELSKMGYVFRGHSDAEWKLKPTLLRYIEKEGITEDIALGLEANALVEFVSQAHLHLSPNEFSLTKDNFSWWTVMQHYGAPTRLLDWTKSIYVAAYFAASNHLEKDGAIWLVHVNSVHKKMVELYNDKSFPKT